jgi:HEPN domain-containing protein
MDTLQENTPRTFVPGFARLDDRIDEHAETLLPQLVRLMNHKLPTTVAAYFLGTLRKETPVLYFLIITSNNEQRDTLSLNSMVEEACKDIASVVVFVHNANNVVTSVDHGNHFFSSILLYRRLVYLSGDTLLPVPSSLNYTLFAQKSSKIWERWYNMSLDFTEGARFYVARANCRLALFSLHQATECVLKAINRVITGYQVEVHNLSRLLTISTLYSDNLVEAFPMRTEDGKLAFDLLKRAYSQSRYKDDFDPDSEHLKSLFYSVVRLQEEAKKLYTYHIGSIDSAI